MERGKNILFLVSRFLDGGIDTVLVEYLNNLQTLTPHRLTLAVMLSMGPELEVYRSRLSPQVQVVYLVPPLLAWYKRRAMQGRRNTLFGLVDEALFNPVRRFLVGRRLARMAGDFDAIVDFDSCWASFIRPEWPQRKIAFFHFSFLQEQQRAPQRIRRLGHRLNRYDRIVTISDAMLQEGKNLFPSQASKFVRIYNFLNPTLLSSKAAASVPQSVRRPYLLAVERLEESQKDVATLLRAYALLYEWMGKERTPYLYIIGKGRDADALRQLADSLRLGDHTPVFLGFQSNPLPWMRGAAAVVHSAKFEGLPTVLIEALMLDKLIVATDCPTGPGEILCGGDAGLLVPVGDAEAFARGVERILTEQTLQENLYKSIARQKKLFLPETCIRQFEALLDEA